MNPHSNTLKIVIADDDSLTRSALRLMLNDHAHRVVAEAADGEKAVEFCVNLNPDVAFIDIDMPRLDGHRAAQLIRSRNPLIRIIMISSLATADNVQRAMSAGAHGFVVKPFTALKVIQALGNCAVADRQGECDESSHR